MKYLLLILFLAGCSSKEKELVEKGSALCRCSGTHLWYIDKTMAHCGNGLNFFNIDTMIILDKCEPPKEIRK